MDTIIEVNKSVSGNRLLTSEIKRDKDGGLQIFVQSDETLWKQFARSDKTTCNFAGVVCYRPAQQELNGVNGYFMIDDTPEVENMPNLMLLLAKDLDKGVTYNFGMLPISEDKLKEFAKQWERQVRIIYLTYIKPVDIRVEFSTKTIDREFHDI